MSTLSPRNISVLSRTFALGASWPPCPLLHLPPEMGLPALCLSPSLRLGHQQAWGTQSISQCKHLTTIKLYLPISCTIFIFSPHFHTLQTPSYNAKLFPWSSHLSFKNNKKGKSITFLYLLTFHHHQCSSSFLLYPSSHLVPFPFIWKTSFNILWNAGLLIFGLAENDFLLPNFFFFITGIGYFSLNKEFPVNFKDTFHRPRIPIVSDERSALICIIIPQDVKKFLSLISSFFPFFGSQWFDDNVCR